MNSVFGERTMMSIIILTRRLKEGKTYEDFRKAWYHTVGYGMGFGTAGKLYTAINVFDPREIIVIGFGEVKLEQQEVLRLAQIEIKERLEHSLEDLIEPEMGRTFGILVSEDDFSPAGELEYKPASINGKETDFKEIAREIALANKLIAQAMKEWAKAKKNQRK
jgi:hypothetical protein